MHRLFSRRDAIKIMTYSRGGVRKRLSNTDTNETNESQRRERKDRQKGRNMDAKMKRKDEVNRRGCKSAEEMSTQVDETFLGRLPPGSAGTRWPFRHFSVFFTEKFMSLC